MYGYLIVERIMNDWRGKQMTKHREGSLTDRLYRELREAILTLGISPGTSLSEGGLAEQFGTSKTPVREALTRLCSEGLVRVIPYKGYYATPISLRDVQRLYQLRLVLETGAVDLAARVATPEDMDTLMVLARVSPQEGMSFSQANTAFHLGIAVATRNDRLESILRNCLENLERVLNIGTSRGDWLWEEHVAVADAVSQRDGEKARKLVSDHIERSQRNAWEQLLTVSKSIVE
jgi:DNA-binding GntR family transcriptional regulator